MLRTLDGLLYKEYVLERYADGSNHKKHGTSDAVTEVFKSIEKVPEITCKPLWATLMDSLYDLPADHEAVSYVNNRGLPKSSHKNLYYVDNVQDIVQLNYKYKDRIITEEPRLAIPFVDENGKLTALSLRGMRGEELRYILVKIDEDASTVYGLDNIDKSMPVTVVEGPLDSLFLSNAIACAGTSFNKIEQLGLDKETLTIVFDNQPKNKDVCKLMSKYIKMGYNICIWPDSIEQKDINDMVNSGISNVQDIIKKHTYNGLRAEMKFTLWRKC
tara:strand:- start:1693 stop:2511 length:819 start_codon:yes stop_codon:yes gene_type:complete